jgi:hypothetical protein
MDWWLWWGAFVLGVVLGNIWIADLRSRNGVSRALIRRLMGWPPEPTWSTLVAPLVGRCDLATKFGFDMRFSPANAKALGQTLKMMAARLDRADVASAGPDSADHG